jgi:hypothetical protein
VLIHGLVNYCVWVTLSRVGYVRVNVTLIHGLVAVKVPPCMVNAVARRIYGSDPGVSELLCVADIIEH